MAPVRCLLRLEAADLCLEFGVLDVAGEVPDAVDEEFLAEREQHRHAIEPGRAECAAAVPVLREAFVDVEGLAAGAELEPLRAVALGYCDHAADSSCAPVHVPSPGSIPGYLM